MSFPIPKKMVLPNTVQKGRERVTRQVEGSKVFADSKNFCRH